MNSEPLKLKALLGDYPNTAALKRGEVKSPKISFDFADVKTPNHAFKRVVRDLEFGVAELAIVTYLMAKAHDKPLALLPAVVRGKFQHESIVCRADAPLAPRDLAGRRVGIRSHSVTTVTWVRGILQNDYGLDLGKVRWVTFEDAHIAEVQDPPGYERAAAGKDPFSMLVAGDLDAAVLTGASLKDPRVRYVIDNPDAAAQAWHGKHGAVPINHMVTIRQSVLDANPGLEQEIFRLLAEARKAAPARGGPDPFPFGIEPNRRSLELIIRYCSQQGLIPREYAVDELFDERTRGLK